MLCLLSKNSFSPLFCYFISKNHLTIKVKYLTQIYPNSPTTVSMPYCRTQYCLCSIESTESLNWASLWWCCFCYRMNSWGKKREKTSWIGRNNQFSIQIFLSLHIRQCRSLLCKRRRHSSGNKSYDRTSKPPIRLIAIAMIFYMRIIIIKMYSATASCMEMTSRLLQ